MKVNNRGRSRRILVASAVAIAVSGCTMDQNAIRDNIGKGIGGVAGVIVGNKVCSDGNKA
ncbi:hypothetical protein [Endothiovibrio diazotrophicus]